MAEAAKNTASSISSKSSREHGDQRPPTSRRAELHTTNAMGAVPDRDIQEEQSAAVELVTKPPFGERPVCFKDTFREVAFVFQATNAIATSSFLQGASAIITVSIGRDLGMTQGEITWITASMALTSGAFQLGIGQLADLLGRRLILIVGLGSFSLFVLLVAFAQNPFWMDVVCGILGVCSAMVVPSAIGIMGAAYATPSKRKNMAFSAFSAGNPLGFVFGSILSGIATKLFNWRASYILIAILWSCFTVLAFWTIPSVEAYQPGVKFKDRLKTFIKTFDFVGTILTVFGAGMLTAGITLGPVDGWNAAHIIAMLVVGVLLLVLFVLWERVWPTPLMPPHIWKDRNFTFIILTCLPGFMSFISSQFWLSFFMQSLQKLSPLEVALHLLPQAIAGLIYNMIVGVLLHRVNNTLLLAIGSVAYVASNVLLSLMRPDSSYWAFVFPSLILSVVGADFQFNVANMYVMQALPSHQQALAGGIFNTLFRLGSAIALGSSTAIFSSSIGTTEALEDPMVPYKKAFQLSIGLCAASFLFLPFIRLGTQGQSRDANSGDSKSEAGAAPPAAITLSQGVVGVPAKAE
ncbi:major facilitator superfamily-domain-containing protein [Podospora appendiculata]|uniref:Major facilitator superfamily-domain-containing protein n=1 Tax=Podospora appendiculata TaxID=314037 RepID=A0AAE0X7B9_9PEZI|nr:major facilitator superfamily-domain-containing protein [Podospora appendiculata]